MYEFELSASNVKVYWVGVIFYRFVSSFYKIVLSDVTSVSFEYLLNNGLNFRYLFGLNIDLGSSLLHLGCADLGEGVIYGGRILISECFLFLRSIGVSTGTVSGTSALPSFANEWFRGYIMHNPV